MAKNDCGRKTVDACQAALNESARLLKHNGEMLDELNRKMDAILEHLGVAYERAGVGCVKEE